MRARSLSELIAFLKNELINKEADLINIYGWNLYQDGELVGGIGCGSIYVLSRSLQWRFARE